MCIRDSCDTSDEDSNLKLSKRCKTNVTLMRDKKRITPITAAWMPTVILLSEKEYTCRLGFTSAIQYNTVFAAAGGRDTKQQYPALCVIFYREKEKLLQLANR